MVQLCVCKGVHNLLIRRPVSDMFDLCNVAASKYSSSRLSRISSSVIATHLVLLFNCAVSG